MPLNKSFLKAAKLILDQEKTPLNVELIIEKALENNELETNGKTPANTMRARLSENIRMFRDKSPFIRISPNIFGLRKWELPEYDKNPFIKGYQGESVICIQQKFLKNTMDFFGYKPFDISLFETIQKSKIDILDRTEAELNNSYKQLISYVLIQNKSNEILTFRRGKYSTANKQLLQGAVCIGFGGHVNKNDYMDNRGNINLFSYFDKGIKASAIREINEELRLNLSNDFKIDYLGFINDNSSMTGLRHLGCVLKLELPKFYDFNQINTERSIKKLQFMSSDELWKNFHEMEFWSQLLLKSFWKPPNSLTPVKIIEGRKKRIEGPISIIGEIATGKTVVANYLSKRYQIPLISTRMCVAEIIGEPDFENGSREIFAKKAMELVSSDNGIKLLANQILSKINKYKEKIILIDGIRNIKTNELIQNEFPNLTTIYIDCPRDKSFELFKSRSKIETNLDEFRNIRSHDVEKEVTLFKNRADMKIYNGGTFDQLILIIGEWFDGKILLSK